MLILHDGHEINVFWDHTFLLILADLFLDWLPPKSVPSKFLRSIAPKRHKTCDFFWQMIWRLPPKNVRSRSGKAENSYDYINIQKSIAAFLLRWIS